MAYLHRSSSPQRGWHPGDGPPLMRCLLTAPANWATLHRPGICSIRSEAVLSPLTQAGVAAIRSILLPVNYPRRRWHQL